MLGFASVLSSSIAIFLTAFQPLMIRGSWGRQAIVLTGIAASTVAGLAGGFFDRETAAGQLGMLLALGVAAVALYSYLRFLRIAQRLRDDGGQQSLADTDPNAGVAIADGPKVKGCAPTLTKGSPIPEVRYKKDGWFGLSSIHGTYSVVCSDTKLVISVKGWGILFYIFYQPTYNVEIRNRTWEIFCLEGNPGCVASAGASGPGPSDTQRALQCNIIESKDLIGASVQLNISISIALNASGGPSVTAGAGGAGMTVAYPDASVSYVAPSAFWVWTCKETA